MKTSIRQKYLNTKRSTYKGLFGGIDGEKFINSMSGALSDGRLKWHLKCAKFGKEGAVRAKTGKDPSGGTDFELFLERGKKKWKATDGELYTSVCACVCRVG